MKTSEEAIRVSAGGERRQARGMKNKREEIRMT